MFTSCSEDLLEIEQKATSSTENFYKTDADAKSAVTAMYATYAEEISGNEGIWNAYIMGLNYASDDVFPAGGDIADHSGFRECGEFRYDTSFGPTSQSTLLTSLSITSVVTRLTHRLRKRLLLRQE